MMKFRTVVLAILASIALAACSLAEDITPPPGYLSPTAPLAASPELPSPTQLPIQAPTAGVTPEAATSLSGTQAASVQTGAVTGKVVPSSAGALPSGLTVSLYGYEPDPNGGSPTQVVSLSLPLLPDGTFKFENVEITAGRIFFSEVDYLGVPYQSNSVVSQGRQPLDLGPVAIYAVTQDLNVLKFQQVHILLDFSTANMIQVVEVYIIGNPGQETVLVPSDGTSVPFVKVPAGATNLSFQSASSSAPFVGTGTGFALLPIPVDQTYDLAAIYDLAYPRRLDLKLPFVQAVDKATLFVPAGVKVAGRQMTDQGLQNIQGTTYHLYESSNLAAGTSLNMTVSGSPGSSASGGASMPTGLVIGLGAFGVVLIAAGLALFLRDRARQKEEQAAEQNAATDDPDRLADAILALDDQYETGGMTKEDYEQRRAELKDRLRNVLG